MACALGFAAPAWSHDFWIAPDRFVSAPNEPVVVTLSMGHPNDVLAWPVSPERAVSLTAVGPDGVIDLQQVVASAMPGARLRLPALPEGHYIVAMTSTQARSELPADSFRSYLDEEGLSPIRDHRAMTGRDGEPGRELYSRRGKALITIGTPNAVPGALLSPIGQTLEIVPENGFFDTRAPDGLSARIRYLGQPADGVQARLVRIDHKAATAELGAVEVKVSADQGRIHFTRPAPGAYTIQAVWSSPARLPNADYATVFSSFSFRVN